MNAKDLTEFHSLVEQFQSEMSLKDICSHEGVNVPYALFGTFTDKKSAPQQRRAFP